MEDRLGQQLGDYRLTELKGRGSFGEVYVGTSLDGAKQVAVKVLQEPLTSLQDVQVLLDEARIFLRFNNDPHIVHLLDFGVTALKPHCQGTAPCIPTSYSASEKV